MSEPSRLVRVRKQQAPRSFVIEDVHVEKVYERQDQQQNPGQAHEHPGVQFDSTFRPWPARAIHENPYFTMPLSM